MTHFSFNSSLPLTTVEPATAAILARLSLGDDVESPEEEEAKEKL